MRRVLAIFAFAGASLAAGLPASAPAQSPATGGTAAGESQTAASGDAGGSVPTGVAPATPGATGGNRYGRPFRIPPVVRRFSASPRSVVWGGAPTTLRFRIDAVGAKTVRVRLLARRAGAGTKVVKLGRRAANRTLSVRWRRAGIAAGIYTLTLAVVDARGKTLARAAAVGLTVRAKPAPKPTTPAPAPSTGSGVFPVAGPHSYGDGFGVDRGDHIHQGQDIPAAEGTPLVAPRAATVFATGYGSGAGEYVVLYDAAADRSYVYFHLVRHSTAVSEGQPVRPGQQVGRVGATGDATGPHLHFELWIGRWFDGGHAVDPLPTLRAWGG